MKKRWFDSIYGHESKSSYDLSEKRNKCTGCHMQSLVHTYLYKHDGTNT